MSESEIAEDDLLIRVTDLLDIALKEPQAESRVTLAALLIYPRAMERWALQKQREVGAHRLRVIPFSGALIGFRTRHVIVVKFPLHSPAEEDRYQRWLNESVKTRLALGCLENLHVVEF